jgi:2-keto-4-pentenoate hydratase/2-oxohepta-3-ene-1,7-dioic acid hydratase in catechol pathway
MKLATFETDDGARHVGAVLSGGETLADLTASDSSSTFRDMLSLIDSGAPGLERARAIISAPSVVRGIAQVRLLAPVPKPRQMRDFLCFDQHWKQARASRNRMAANGQPTDPARIELPAIWYKEPIYYKCNRFAVIGTGADIVMPSYTQQLDYELEFGFFLGKRGRNIRREDARSHIYGYCIFNDVSARDQQGREMQGTLGPTKGKDFDTGNVLGPWLVTADEIPDPYALTMVARINGEEWSRGSSESMGHKFEDILVHASRDETLYPGEFFGSGTVGGGCGLELGRFLQPGDTVELEVEGLGTLRNTIAAPRP